jgi:hypothetical protein
MYGLVARKNEHKSSKMKRAPGGGSLYPSDVAMERLGNKINKSHQNKAVHAGKVGTVWFEMVMNASGEKEVHPLCVAVMKAFFDGSLSFVPHHFCSLRTGPNSDTLIHWPRLYEDEELDGIDPAAILAEKFVLRAYGSAPFDHFWKLRSVPKQGDFFKGTPRAYPSVSPALALRVVAARVSLFCSGTPHLSLWGRPFIQRAGCLCRPQGHEASFRPQ